MKGRGYMLYKSYDTLKFELYYSILALGGSLMLIAPLISFLFIWLSLVSGIEIKPFSNPWNGDL
jgi:hypothetical protein